MEQGHDNAKKCLSREEKRLIGEQKKNPFDIDINMKLAAYYRGQQNWPEAEHHEEIVEWLDRIRRFAKAR